jgi:CubicO group peptidase (beta-lactamase class C family)
MRDGFDAVTRLMMQGVTDGCFPGAVLVVGSQGHLIFESAVGAAALVPTARQMTTETVFDLASLTKAIATTTALMLLVDRGQVHLDAPLSAYLPAFGENRSCSPTPRQLLSHNAGLPACRAYYQDASGDWPQPKRRGAVYRAAHAEPLVTAPGAAVQYSDIGFILLGEVVETVSGLPFEVFWSEAICDALHLPGVRFYDPAQALPNTLPFASTEACPWRGRVLSGEVHDENAWIMGGVAGHAGLFATARDVWRFAQGLLDGWHGCSWLVSTATLHAFLQRQGLPWGSTWALGWDTPTPGRSSAGHHFSATSIGHLGFTGTSVWIDLLRQVIVVLLTNRVHPSRQREGIKAFRPAIHDAVMQALHIAPAG